MGVFTENNLVFRRPQQPNQPNVGGPGQIPGSGHITNVNGQPPNQINPNAPVFHPTGDEYSPRPHVNPSSTFNPGFNPAQQQSQVKNPISYVELGNKGTVPNCGLCVQKNADRLSLGSEFWYGVGNKM